MSALRSALPTCAAALLLCLATIQPALADRGERAERGHRGDWVRPIAPRYPRHSLVVHHRPALWTLVTVGALSYIYANGVYYREYDTGGYVVVAPPEDERPVPAAAHVVTPRQGQSADRQASDEYACHRWAVQQTGFDPSRVALGTAPGASAGQRSAYPRARDACLEGRGYSVQ